LLGMHRRRLAHSDIIAVEKERRDRDRGIIHIS